MAKMRVKYSPEGGSPREWVLDMGNPDWDVSYGTEKATDWPWSIFHVRLIRASAIAWRALLWTLRKRDEPRLSIESVTVDWSELETEYECADCGEWADEDHDCGATEDAAPDAEVVEPDPEA